MAKRFLVPLNVLRSSSNPATGTEGDVYFNTTSQELRVYSEGIWKSIGYDISASVASIPYVDTQIDDIYDFIFDGLTTDDIQQGEYNFYFTNENILTVAGSAINAASANALNEAIIYTDAELSNLNIFSTIVTEPATQTITGDSNSDALTFIAGENISITAASASDSITINSTGNYTSVDSISYPDYLVFDTTPENTSASTGTLAWDSGESGLSAQLNPNINVTLGQEIYSVVYNGEATQLNKGEVVMVSGAQGQKPRVIRAYNTSDAGSARTFGIVSENIASGAEGIVITQGIVKNINTNGFNEGDPLYLSATPGQLTTTKPQAPNHYVWVGVVIKKNSSSGRIYVKPQNGYELDEIHDVRITSIQNDDIIVYNSASSIWQNSNRFSTLETLVSEIEQNNNELITTVVNTNSPTPVDTYSIGTATTVEYLLQIKQGTKYYSAKIIAVNNETVINHNIYGIITIGDPISGLSITTSISSGSCRLWVQVSDGLTTNAEVKVLKTKIL